MINKAKQSQTSSLHLNNKAALGVALAALCFTPGLGVQRAFAAPAEVPVSAPAVQTVTGTVVDATGEPIIGASVKVKGSNTGAVTDIDGNFTLRANTGAEIEISYVGMTTQTFRVVEGQSSYNITLQDNTDALNEVVVVGYGAQKRVNLTGAVSSINADKISESRPITNVSQALAGLAAGVTVRSGNNQPGNDNATIRVRGVGTLNDAGPLVIVDGVEAGINTVDPNDIESMSILKDAASASIYGSRAANGVILITTKKGEAGNVKVNYNGYVSFESMRKTLEPVSDYATYMELVNEGMKNTNPNASLPFSQEKIDEWRNSPTDLLHPNTNWVDETFKSATATNHTLSVSGGSDRIRFFTSFGYNYNPGIMPNAAYQRYSARVKVEADVKKWLTVGVNASGFRGETEAGARVQNDIFTYASATTPGMVFVAPDGRFGYPANPEDSGQSYNNNPIARTQQVQGKNQVNNLRVGFTGIVRPYEGVSITANYNYQLRDTRQRNKPKWVYYWDFANEQIMQTNERANINLSYSAPRLERFFWDAVARWDKKFGDLEMNLMAGYSSELYRSSTLIASRDQLLDLNLWALNAATGTSNASGATTEWSMQSWFGRVNLNWANRYLLELNIRRDGSSRFASGNRWGTFPSVSAGWRLDQESFMQGLVEKGINSLKFRVSYGSLGNNSIDNYETQAVYDLYNYNLNSTVATGLAIYQLANPNLKWESTHVFNVGADFAFLNNRLFGGFDWFYKKTDNILMDLPAPAVHGTSAIPTVNAAQVSNKGIELTLNWNDRIGNVNYGATFNGSYVKNNIDKFKGKGPEGRDGSTTVKWEGHAIGTLFMLRNDGIIQTQEQLDVVTEMLKNDKSAFAYVNYKPGQGPQMGDLMYRDLDGDGKITAEDREVVWEGGRNPRFLLSLNLHAEWKGIDFSMLLESSLGAKAYFNQTHYNTAQVRVGYQINKEIADGRWYEGRTTPASYPRLLDYNTKTNTVASDFYLSSLDYLKIRNLTLGYTLPKAWTRKIDIDRVRIYGSLENFFTFTGFKGFDPEVSNMTYPTMRQAVVGLNVSF
jgi:tonB-linked outer membrane protein, susC/ragA family